MHIAKSFQRLFPYCMILLLSFNSTQAIQKKPEFDVLIRNGTVYDGSGSPGIRADVAIREDKIVEIGTLPNSSAKLEIDATGLAVAPGFINMLSWAAGTLLIDGRSQ